MELHPRNASHFPSIKCSTCGEAIDLAFTSEHVCVTPGSAPFTSAGPLPVISSTSFPPRDISSLRPQRPALPKIDSSVAVPVPFAGELTPASSGNGSIGSPVSATSGRRSPWRAPTRRPTIMVQHGPPSPELINLDCAFPPFPVMNSKDATKQEKSKIRGDKHSKSRPASPVNSSRSSKQYLGPSPLSRSTSNGSSRPRSKSTSGDSRLRRPSISTNGRRPPPSNTGSRNPSAEDIPPIPTPSSDLINPPPPRQLFERADTAPVFPLRSNDSQEAINDLQRHATTDGVLHYEPEPMDYSTIQAASQEPEVEFANPFPLAQPPKDSEPAYRSKRPPPIVSNIAMAPTGFNPKMRSPTVPPLASANGLSRSLTKLFGRRRSQSASAAKREIVRNALSDEPDNEIPTPPIPLSAFGSLRHTPTTSRSAPDSAAQPSSAPLISDSGPTERKDSLEALGGSDLISVPPVVIEPAMQPPAHTEAMQFSFDWNQPEQTDSPVDVPASASIARRPTEVGLNRASIDSASSYGSIGFDERTASSRSSPPPTDELASKFSDLLHTEPTQMIAGDMPPLLRPRNLEVCLDSPTDPLFIGGMLSPIPAENHKIVENSRLETPPPTHSIVPARKDSLASSSKPPRPTKGICRGCSKPILPKQKSVTSADGRLSGRYHKKCFVCSTCKSTFSTAEFYVHADRPYCAYHYHEKENSLCATCGKGIEGLYMETANVAGRGREKHHPQCLKCTTCRVQLNNDYFELSGKVYCERDAFRLASIPRVHDRSPARPSPLVREYISSGDPKLLQKGTNFPERRITRITTTMT